MQYHNSFANRYALIHINVYLNDLYDNVVSKDQPKMEIGINWILVDINDAY